MTGAIILLVVVALLALNHHCHKESMKLEYGHLFVDNSKERRTERMADILAWQESTMKYVREACSGSVSKNCQGTFDCLNEDYRVRGMDGTDIHRMTSDYMCQEYERMAFAAQRTKTLSL